MTTINSEFEVVFIKAGYAGGRSLVGPGQWHPDHWALRYYVGDREWDIALNFPTRREAERAKRICELLGITPEIYWRAANSPAGSGELRRKIIEMLPW